MEHRILVDNIKENFEQFKNFHYGDYYGGSEVAAICGVGYESPLDVWLRKTGKTGEVKETDQMVYGRLIEPVVANLLARKLGKDIVGVNQVWQHPTLDWYIGSPDAAIFNEPTICEFKSHKIYAEKYWSEDTASDSAQCQLQWYLGLDKEYAGGYCAAIIGGDAEKFYYPYFERDDALIEQLIHTVEQFRELVKSDTPPQAGPGDAEKIKQHLVNSIDKNKEVDLTESHLDLLSEYEELELRKKELEPQLKDLEEKIKAIKNEFVKDCQGAGIIRVGKGYVKLSHIVTSERMVKGSDYYRVTIKVS